MAIVKQDVIYRAFRIVGYISANEEPEAEDYADAETEYNSLVAWISSEMNYDVTDTDVDAEHHSYISAMLAGRLAYAFPLSDKGAERGIAAANKGAMDFRKVIARKSRTNVAVPLV